MAKLTEQVSEAGTPHIWHMTNWISARTKAILTEFSRGTSRTLSANDANVPRSGHDHFQGIYNLSCTKNATKITLFSTFILTEFDLKTTSYRVSRMLTFLLVKQKEQSK